jgi:hypothetical protein
MGFIKVEKDMMFKAFKQGEALGNNLIIEDVHEWVREWEVDLGQLPIRDEPDLIMGALWGRDSNAGVFAYTNNDSFGYWWSACGGTTARLYFYS